MERALALNLPSAGMIRFRFDGSASLHLRPLGHPEVMVNIGRDAAGARVEFFAVQAIGNAVLKGWIGQR
jgi:hypothetical protein